jgi:hypothetical protein
LISILYGFLGFLAGEIAVGLRFVQKGPGSPPFQDAQHDLDARVTGAQTFLGKIRKPLNGVSDLP